MDYLIKLLKKNRGALRNYGQCIKITEGKAIYTNGFYLVESYSESYKEERLINENLTEIEISYPNTDRVKPTSFKDYFDEYSCEMFLQVAQSIKGHAELAVKIAPNGITKLEKTNANNSDEICLSSHFVAQIFSALPKKGTVITDIKFNGKDDPILIRVINQAKGIELEITLVPVTPGERT